MHPDNQLGFDLIFFVFVFVDVSAAAPLSFFHSPFFRVFGIVFVRLCLSPWYIYQIKQHLMWNNRTLALSIKAVLFVCSSSIQ